MSYNCVYNALKACDLNNTNNKKTNMKKQNVNNKLAFTKAAVAELNENTLNQVNGGASINDIVDAITSVINQMTKPILR